MSKKLKIELSITELSFLHTVLHRCKRNDLTNIPLLNKKEREEIHTKYSPYLEKIKQILFDEETKILTNLTDYSPIELESVYAILSKTKAHRV